MEIQLRSDMDCEYVQHMGSDEMCARAAWVSTGNDMRDASAEKIRGTLGFLMKNRHGTPFEQNAITFRVNAPIFIWREWHRHRVGFSYNEESGRYKQLAPVFYVPGPERASNCIKPKDFKPSKPGWRGMLERSWEPFLTSMNELARGGSVQADNRALAACYEAAYGLYENRINEIGYDNGLARICLPVAIYSACYVTCNARSLMHFLELRTDTEEAFRRSAPLWELHMLAANQVEPIFAEYFPVTYALWNECKRMSP